MVMTTGPIAPWDTAARAEAEQLAEDKAQARRRRRRLLAITAPFALIVVAVAGRFVGQQFGFWHADGAYEDAQYTVAADRFDGLKTFSLVQSHLPYFDAGTALYQQGDYEAAADRLWTALALTTARDRCAVSTNLGLTVTAQADVAEAAGNHTDALTMYTLAGKVMDESGCPEPQKDQAQQNLEDRKDTARQNQQQESDGGQSGQEGQDGQEGQGSGEGGSGGQEGAGPTAQPSEGTGQNGQGQDSGGQGQSGPTAQPSQGQDGSGQNSGGSDGQGDGSGQGSSGDSKIDELQERNRRAQDYNYWNDYGEEYGLPPRPTNPPGW